jgi:hypothetical protein
MSYILMRYLNNYPTTSRRVLEISAVSQSRNSPPFVEPKLYHHGDENLPLSIF